MSFRAPDVKDEDGWLVLDENDNVAFRALTREDARKLARNHNEHQNGSSVEVLPPDESPEAVAGREAWTVDQRIKQIKKATESLYVELAHSLYEFHDGEMWATLGYDSLTEYFSDPDVQLDPRWAYNLIAIYRQLVVERGVDENRLKELEVSKVTEALPAIRRGQVSVDEAFADIKALSKRDLKLKLSGRASETPGQPDTGTSISTESEPEWAVCPSCGSRYQVDGSGQRV